VVIVVLVALVQAGDIVLAIPGSKLDATGLAALAATGLNELARFRHLERPAQWNLAALKALFELLGMDPDMAHHVAQGKQEPVQRLQQAIGATVGRIVMAQQALRSGLHFWGEALLVSAGSCRQSAELAKAKNFLESLQAYSSPDKIKNLRYGADDILAIEPAVRVLLEQEALRAFIAAHGPTAAWLVTAEAVMPAEHVWVQRTRAVRREVLKTLQQADPAGLASQSSAIGARLQELKRNYLTVYLELHAKARLDVNDARRRAALLDDPRLQTLRELAEIELLPRWRLDALQQRLTGMEPCSALIERDLVASPVCPHCRFRPAVETAALIGAAMPERWEAELDALLAGWRSILLGHLEHPATRDRLDLLESDERDVLEHFISARALLVPLDGRFVPALRAAFADLHSVPLEMAGLQEALRLTDGTATPLELKQRFEAHIERLSEGKDPSTLWVVVE
jgi:hypothetical protein